MTKRFSGVGKLMALGLVVAGAVGTPLAASAQGYYHGGGYHGGYYGRGYYGRGYGHGGYWSGGRWIAGAAVTGLVAGLVGAAITSGPAYYAPPPPRVVYGPPVVYGAPVVYAAPRPVYYQDGPGW